MTVSMIWKMKFRNANWVIENYLYYIFSECDLTLRSKLYLFSLVSILFRTEPRNAWGPQAFRLCKHSPEAPVTQKFTLGGETRGPLSARNKSKGLVIKQKQQLANFCVLGLKHSLLILKKNTLFSFWHQRFFPFL